MSAKVYIGTSGYSYDDWKEIFYPPKMSRKDFLEFYSNYFNAVEVNFTYYQMPFRRTIEALLRKSQGKLKFVIKSHQSLTHERIEREEPYIKFQNAIQPLADAGSLSCVLAQFPFNFKRNPENIKFLERFGKRMNQHPLVVEFRHASWVNKDIFTLLENLGIGFCCVDEPKLPGLVPKVLAKTTNIGYLRFHGRNAETWWKYSDQSERYDYLYSKREIGDWFHRLKSFLDEIDEMYIFFNNHPRAQSIKNAFMMMDYYNMEPKYEVFQELFQLELDLKEVPFSATPVDKPKKDSDKTSEKEPKKASSEILEETSDDVPAETLDTSSDDEPDEIPEDETPTKTAKKSKTAKKKTTKKKTTKKK